MKPTSLAARRNSRRHQLSRQDSSSSQSSQYRQPQRLNTFKQSAMSEKKRMKEPEYVYKTTGRNKMKDQRASFDRGEAPTVKFTP